MTRASSGPSVIVCAAMTPNALTSTSLSVLFVSALACGGTATAPAASTTTPGTSAQYSIVLHRPLRAGEEFRVVVDAKQKIEGVAVTSIDNRESSRDIGNDVEVSLAGVVTIREVDADGRAVSALMDVERFTAAAKSEPLVPPGTKIDFVRGRGQFSAMVNGEPRPDLLELLRLAFPLQRPGSPLGDQLFGSQEPRAIGDSWAFSKNNVAQNLLEDGYRVSETDLSGDTRLTGKTTVNGIECLELSSTVHADQAAMSEAGDVKGTGTGKLDSTVKMVVPVDPKLPLAMEETTTRALFQGHAHGESASLETGTVTTRYRKALYTRMDPSPTTL